MANAITLLRIAGSLAMAFSPAPAFWVLYCACGISDMLDGWIARRTGTASALGARLDSLADMVFAAVSLIRILPALQLPGWLLGWTAVILLIRLVNLASGWVMHRRLIAAHTALNRAAGMLVFLLPLTLRLVPLACSAPVVCSVATLASIQEGHTFRTGRTAE